jgi:hypothetical protein
VLSVAEVEERFYGSGRVRGFGIGIIANVERRTAVLESKLSYVSIGGIRLVCPDAAHHDRRLDQVRQIDDVGLVCAQVSNGIICPCV